MIWAYSSKAHYSDHIRPIWDAIPAELKGEWIGPWGESTTTLKVARQRARFMLVAGAVDASQFRYTPTILVEHGAGQTYKADNRSSRSPSYAGGDGLDHVVLFLSPSQRIADLWQDRYPKARVAAVGCPKLDRYLGRDLSSTHDPLVGITFHWDCRLIPETRSALNWYRAALPQIEKASGRLIGHWHPSLHFHGKAAYDRAHVASTPVLDPLLRTADLLIADNTSALYEFAAIGRPTIVLNAPCYRRQVEHGMRFWSHVPGPQVENADELIDLIPEVLAKPHAFDAERRRAAEYAYAFLDGSSTARSIAAILELMPDPYASKPKVRAPRPPEEPMTADYPYRGTVADVLAWVDGGIERAAAAREIELGNRARVSLVAALNEIIEGPVDPDEYEPPEDTDDDAASSEPHWDPEDGVVVDHGALA